jgi:hypothetical protein
MDPGWEEKKSRMLQAIAAEMDVSEEKAEYMAISRMHVDLFPGHNGNNGGAREAEFHSPPNGSGLPRT